MLNHGTISGKPASVRVALSNLHKSKELEDGVEAHGYGLALFLNKVTVHIKSTLSAPACRDLVDRTHKRTGSFPRCIFRVHIKRDSAVACIFHTYRQVSKNLKGAS